MHTQIEIDGKVYNVPLKDSGDTPDLIQLSDDGRIIMPMEWSETCPPLLKRYDIATTWTMDRAPVMAILVSVPAEQLPPAMLREKIREELTTRILEGIQPSPGEWAGIIESVARADDIGPDPVWVLEAVLGQLTQRCYDAKGPAGREAARERIKRQVSAALSRVDGYRREPGEWEPRTAYPQAPSTR